MKYGSFPPGWWFEVSDGTDESVLIITGPDGQGAAFPVERGQARSLVLQNLMIDSAAEPGTAK